VSELLKLSAYFGERDRSAGRFTADTMIDIFERRQLEASLLFRGAEGFGLKHHLQTDRLLSMSEDLPVVAVAIGTATRVEAVLDEVTERSHPGLLTIERARLPGSSEAPSDLSGSSKLTVILGRHQRVEGEPAYRYVTRRLHGLGLKGATVLLGVDGTVDGQRRRGRFFGSNTDVPLAVISVGDADIITKAVGELSTALPEMVLLQESTRILKRDGRRVSELDRSADLDEKGIRQWNRLTVYASEQSRHEGAPLYPQVLRNLREAGAIGATVLKGVWGFHGEHEPHGDTFWSVRRRIPVVVEVIDSPSRCREWFRIIDDLTAEAGLVTSEAVPRVDGPTG